MMKKIYTRSFQEKAERLIISNNEIQCQSINKKVAVRNHYKQKHKNGTQANLTKGECKKNYQFLICRKVVSHWSPLRDVSFARTNTKSLLTIGKAFSGSPGYASNTKPLNALRSNLVLPGQSLCRPLGNQPSSYWSAQPSPKWAFAEPIAATSSYGGISEPTCLSLGAVPPISQELIQLGSVFSKFSTMN